MLSLLSPWLFNKLTTSVNFVGQSKRRQARVGHAIGLFLLLEGNPNWKKGWNIFIAYSISKNTQIIIIIEQLFRLYI